MTRSAEIADYLLSLDASALEPSRNGALVAAIVARWPDVTRHDLEAGFQIAALEMAAQFANALAARCDAAAVAVARATAANARPA